MIKCNEKELSEQKHKELTPSKSSNVCFELLRK
jgi:hypothetical protein